ncbi:hypothetical protein QVD17_02416 [Tagetes erecta]|uniref:Uncharacterized protein n=1 Tax=Tagetes erecta TaxID=13708 RepID=A0AAD8L6J6_TARER|nr:hypothetical protein QVD17_02416 [Tagetes erecta]
MCFEQNHNHLLSRLFRYQPEDQEAKRSGLINTCEIMEKYMDSRYANYAKEVDSYGYSQKYKGVVPQQNGNWGAQIYTNNQRIWLGTFKTEVDAAIAYDRASMKLRSVDAPRNFQLTKSTVLEASFQSHYTMETILAMIKDGSYQAKFDDYQRQKRKDDEKDDINPSVEKANYGYFPPVPDEPSHGFANDEVNLSFYDTKRRLWKFRYCYWKSSQSFVFTRGWNQFVKDKKLMPKDKITFYYQENLEMPNMGFWVIDTCMSASRIGASLKLGVEDDEDSLTDHKRDEPMIQTSSAKTHGLKLFGVHIYSLITR